MAFVVRLVLLASLVFLQACASPKLSENAALFQVAVEETKTQTLVAFDQANDLVRKQSAARLLAGPATGLKEEDFPFLIYPQDRQKWAEIYGLLSDYAGLLVKLTDPGLGKATGDAAAGLAASMNGKLIGADLSAGFQALFSATAGAIARNAAELSAVKIMRETDADFARVTTLMAEQIGEDQTSPPGLIFDVYKLWQGVLAARSEDFIAAKGDVQKRTAAINGFVQVMDARDAQIKSLLDLRKSTLALSQMHSAMAKGNERTALFWLEQIDVWAEDIKNRQSALGEGKDNGKKT